MYVYGFLVLIAWVFEAFGCAKGCRIASTNDVSDIFADPIAIRLKTWRFSYHVLFATLESHMDFEAKLFQTLDARKLPVFLCVKVPQVILLILTT